MRNNIKKTFVSILVATTIATSASAALASKITVNIPHSIYETKTSDHLSSGVVHETILKFTTSGWWNINVLRVDLTDPHTDIKGLFNPNGIPNREKVSSMVERSNAIAGINGDYFNFAPMASAMGTLINEGEVISSPIERPYDLPTFFIDVLGQAKIGFVDRYTTVRNLRSEQIVFINTINKVTKDFDTVTLLNKHWGKNSIGNRFHNDLIEVVVEDNIVKDVRQGQPPTAIPENGYVLAIRGERHQDLHTFLVGDEIKLHVSTTPDVNSIKFAIGGGSTILKDGELSLTHINSKGNNPRTGIGISKDGEELILVTIDGRGSSFKGVSQELFGAILRDLGAYNALNLDGGGSTTMAVKPVDEDKVKVVNKPSDGGERPVVNGVGVFSDAPIGELSYIKVSTEDSNMFIDTSRTFKVKGYDEYHNPVVLDDSKLKFTHEGVGGEIEGNRFKAYSSGKATITAHYDDISASTDVKILGTVKHISTDLSNFNIDINSERKLPTFTARDANGYTAKVDSRDISFTTVNNIGHVNNGVFYSGDTSLAGALTAKLGDGLANILVSVGSNATLVQGFENLNNLSFAPYPTNVTGGISLSNDIKQGSNSLSLKYDFSNSDADTRAAYLNFTNSGSGLPLPGIPKKLGLWVKGDSNGSWLRGTIKDNKANSHTVDFAKSIDFDDWRYLTVDIPSNVNYPISLERVYVVETDTQKKHTGELLVDGLTASYPPTVGTVVLPNPSSLKDEKNKSSSIAQDGFSIGVAMEPKGLNDLVQYDATSKIKERFNKHKMSIFLGGSSAEFQKGLTSPSRINANSVYHRDRYGDVSFININTEKQGIRSTNSSQWTKLKNDLNSINTNNLIVFLSSPMYGTGGFTDVLEADLLHTLLGEVQQQGKNVFVVHGGSSTTTDLKDGIRYIGVNTKPISKPEDIYNLSMVEFIVNGSDITYEINPLFPKPQVKPQ